jgi:hypothetical protein
MTSLWTLQEEFTLALLDRTREAPVGLRTPSGQAERRFDVYRNNVFVSLIEALATRFPVCQALVGDEFFRAMARVYIELSPPRSPLLMRYGEDFGDFIDTFPPARSVPYLGDMARLEAARTRAYHAADAKPLRVEELASLSSCAWSQTRVALHPSVEVLRSPYPIVTIWEAHARPNEAQAIDGSVAEDALVIRPDLEVEVHRLLPGGAVFVSMLLHDATFREATDEAVAATPRFDLVANLTGLLVNRIIVGLSSVECRPVMRD